MKKLILAFTALLAMSTSVFAEIGSADKDLVFTPITPCRIMDTRNPGSASGVLAAGSIRTFYANSVTNNYPNQGGNVPTCGLPFTSNVAAVVLNFTVVSPAAGGYITAFPANVADVDKPLAATVNFAAGAVVGNNATLKISQLSADGGFKIYSSTSTHVVADVVGYYIMPVATALQCEDTTPVTATINATPFNSLYYNFAEASACSAGYTQVALRCYTNNAIASAHEYSNGSCAGNSPINTHTLFASRRCCRIPGR
jgi:hypothetical protein